ncbi:MAG: hypothetical protein J07HB67_01171 [halophilic archaeon J07HB67]|nr:MAG: hypothetical protein J07HB67_01171 [halophilic archaeon J07HB67]
MLGTAAGRETGDGTTTTDGGGGLPSGRDTALGVVAVLGAVAGARRTGVTARAYRFLWTVYQPATDDTTTATERAYRRLETLAEREYRPREPGETPRQYVDSVVRRGLDERAREVADAYERAHYGHGVSAETADDAVTTVDRLVRSRIPVVRRFV